MGRIASRRQSKPLERYADAYAHGQRLAAVTAERDAARRAAQTAEATRQAFLSGLNHELRTPLNHIIGFAELLKNAEDYDLCEDKRSEYVQHILSAAGTLLGQINEILEAAGYGKPRQDEPQGAQVVPALRRIFQEASSDLFVSKVDLANDLPPTALSENDLFALLNMLFSVLPSRSGAPAAIGIGAALGLPDQGCLDVTISLLSETEAADLAHIETVRAEAVRLGGDLEVEGASQSAQRIILRLPIRKGATP